MLHKMKPCFLSWMETQFPADVLQKNLQNSLAFCGLDTKRYQSHSFRIGAATAAADLGASDIQIQNMGRWKSTAFKKYIRVPVLTL